MGRNGAGILLIAFILFINMPYAYHAAFLPIGLKLGSRQFLMLDASHKFWITDYMEWHRINRKSPRARRLIFSPVAAGLGDNLRGLIRSYLYAVVTRRIFLVDWKRPFPLARAIDTSWYAFDPKVDLPNNASVRSFHFYRMSNRELYSTLKGSTKVVRLQTGYNNFMHDTVTSLCGAYQRCSDIPPHTDDTLRAVGHIILRPSKEAAARHRQNLSRLTLCVGSRTKLCPNHDELASASRKDARQYISVHARLGIGTGEYMQRFKHINGNESTIARCLAIAVRRIQDRMGYVSPKVLLATDTPSFRNTFRHAMRDVYPKAQVVWLGGRVIHYTRIPGGQFAESFDHLFDEMRLIGDAAHIIRFTSGFSTVAYLMGNAMSITELWTDTCIRS